MSDRSTFSLGLVKISFVFEYETPVSFRLFLRQLGQALFACTNALGESRLNFFMFLSWGVTKFPCQRAKASCWVIRAKAPGIPTMWMPN
jgi:hypothetical protein